MVAATVLSDPNAIDKSYAHTDAKEHQNILAMTADGTVLKKGLYKATINAASLTDGVGATTNVTGCVGVLLGRTAVQVIAPVDLVDMTVTAYCQADGILEVRIQNESGSATDLASGVYYFLTETIDINL